MAAGSVETWFLLLLLLPCCPASDKYLPLSQQPSYPASVQDGWPMGSFSSPNILGLGNWSSGFLNSVELAFAGCLPLWHHTLQWALQGMCLYQSPVPSATALTHTQGESGMGKQVCRDLWCTAEHTVCWEQSTNGYRVQKRQKLYLFMKSQNNNLRHFRWALAEREFKETRVVSIATFTEHGFGCQPLFWALYT